MKVLAVVCVVPALGFRGSAPPSQRRVAVRSQIETTTELLDIVKQKTEACLERGECELDEFLEIRGDLAVSKDKFGEQLLHYADDDDDEDEFHAGADVTGATAEATALHKYITTVRNLHDAISQKLTELDQLLARLSDCRKEQQVKK